MDNKKQQYRLHAPINSRFQRICVFCGSSPGKNPSYQLAAIQLGNQLVRTYVLILIMYVKLLVLLKFGDALS